MQKPLGANFSVRLHSWINYIIISAVDGNAFGVSGRDRNKLIVWGTLDIA